MARTFAFAALLALSAFPVVAGQAEDLDLVETRFPWAQPDPRADEASHPNVGSIECAPPPIYDYAPWADIRELSGITLDDGRLFFKIRVEDFANATSDYAYTILFAVNDKPYQASFYTRFNCSHQAGARGTMVWKECGTTASTFSGPGCGTDAFKEGTWLLESDEVVLEIKTSVIGDLTPGTIIKGIQARAYEWYGLSGNGVALLRDRVEPTVAPLDFTYGPTPAPSSSAASQPTTTVSPGSAPSSSPRPTLTSSSAETLPPNEAPGTQEEASAVQRAEAGATSSVASIGVLVVAAWAGLRRQRGC